MSKVGNYGLIILTEETLSELIHRAKDTFTRPIYPGIHVSYTPNTRKFPLLYSIVPQATPSLPVLFKMCIAGLLATLILL